MTELSPEPRGGESRAPSYSKDYWDQVFDQLARRRLFRLAMIVLVFLYGAAIYAPLLASDLEGLEPDSALVLGALADELGEVPRGLDGPSRLVHFDADLRR